MSTLVLASHWLGFFFGGRRRPPRVLRQSPVDPFQQISQLRWRQRDGAIRILARNARRLHEPAAFEPLGEQAHALPVVPETLISEPRRPRKTNRCPPCGSRRSFLLHQQCPAIKSLARVGVPHRKPRPHPARHRDHRRRAIFASASISAVVIDGSIGPVIFSR